jgi:hypothetical protein
MKQLVVTVTLTNQQLHQETWDHMHQLLKVRVTERPDTLCWVVARRDLLRLGSSGMFYGQVEGYLPSYVMRLFSLPPVLHSVRDIVRVQVRSTWETP